jgi:arginase
MNRYLLTPYLMGQKRDGLRRVNDVDDSHDWQVLAHDDFSETKVSDANEQMRRMGKVYSSLAKAVKELAGAGEVPFSIAGDCVSTLGVLGGLQQAGRSPDRILWLDAHGDFHTWGTTQTHYIGGMPLAMLVGRADRRKDARDAVGALRAAIGVKAFPEERIVLSDARDTDPGETEALQASDIVTCAIDDILDHLDPEESLYVHWDTDVVDAKSETPALKYHVSGGPSYEDIGALFKSLKGRKIVAVSVSAWHEEKDMENKAAIACLKLLKELE